MKGSGWGGGMMMIHAPNACGLDIIANLRWLHTVSIIVFVDCDWKNVLQMYYYYFFLRLFRNIEMSLAVGKVLHMWTKHGAEGRRVMKVLYRTNFCRDTGPRFFRFHSQDPWLLLINAECLAKEWSLHTYVLLRLWFDATKTRVGPESTTSRSRREMNVLNVYVHATNIVRVKHLYENATYSSIYLVEIIVFYFVNWYKV